MRLVLLFILTVIGTIHLSAQQDTTDTKAIIVKNANSQVFDMREDSTLYLNGDVVLIQDSLYFYCDTARLVNNNIYAHGNIVLMQSDSIRLFSDSLHYEGDSLIADFKGNVVLEDSDNQLFTSRLLYDIGKGVGMYTDTALLKSNDYELKSKRGFYYPKSKTVDFYDNVTITGTDFLLVTDSIRYFTASEKAIFMAPTNINNKDQRLYSQRGYYYTNNNNSKFYGNAQYLDNERKAAADTVIYNGTEKDVTFKGNAEVTTDEELARANVIHYKQVEKLLTLSGNAYYVNKDRIISGTEIIYNENTDHINVNGSSFLTADQYIIQGEKVNYDNKSGLAYLDGTVSITDTLENLSIHSDHAIYNNTAKNMVAYNDIGNPYIQDIDDTDTLYISGDTLFYYQEIIESDTLENDTAHIFKAYYNVRILSSNVAGSCDSIIYDGRDSIISLHGAPVLFSDSTQFSSDTIRLHLVNKKMEHIDLLNNALIVNTPDLMFFNQIAGDNGEVFFQEDSIQRLDIVGNAKSIYYLIDDEGAYIGVNKTSSESLAVLFEQNKIRYIKYFIEPKKDLLPMDTNHDALKVKGFFWKFNNRPKNLLDLIR